MLMPKLGGGGGGICGNQEPGAVGGKSIVAFVSSLPRLFVEITVQSVGSTLSYNHHSQNNEGLDEGADRQKKYNKRN